MNYMSYTKVTAHSGADGTEDNSAAFLRYALATEADAVEVDVRLSEDALYLSHDAVYNPATATQLSEAFELLRGCPDKQLNCDLKEAGLELAVLDLAREYEVENQLIYSGTVDLALLDLDDASLDDVQVYLNIENLLQPEAAVLRDKAGRMNPDELAQLDFSELVRPLLVRASELRIAAVNMPYQLYSPKVAEAAADLGLGLSLWTVDDERMLFNLMNAGVLNVTTRSIRRTLSARYQMQVRPIGAGQ